MSKSVIRLPLLLAGFLTLTDFDQFAFVERMQMSLCAGKKPLIVMLLLEKREDEEMAEKREKERKMLMVQLVQLVALDKATR